MKNIEKKTMKILKHIYPAMIVLLFVVSLLLCLYSET